MAQVCPTNTGLHAGIRVRILLRSFSWPQSLISSGLPFFPGCGIWWQGLNFWVSQMQSPNPATCYYNLGQISQHSSVSPSVNWRRQYLHSRGVVRTKMLKHPVHSRSLIIIPFLMGQGQEVREDPPTPFLRTSVYTQFWLPCSRNSLLKQLPCDRQDFLCLKLAPCCWPLVCQDP